MCRDHVDLQTPPTWENFCTTSAFGSTRFAVYWKIVWLSKGTNDWQQIFHLWNMWKGFNSGFKPAQAYRQFKRHKMVHTNKKRFFLQVCLGIVCSLSYLKTLFTWTFLRCGKAYDSFSVEPIIWVRRGHESESGQMVLKKVKLTYFDAYLWQTMWNHAKKSMEESKLSDSVFLQWDARSSVLKTPKKHKN